MEDGDPFTVWVMSEQKMFPKITNMQDLSPDQLLSLQKEHDRLLRKRRRQERLKNMCTTTKKDVAEFIQVTNAETKAEHKDPRDLARWQATQRLKELDLKISKT